ncbi:MAG: geranyl transferase [Waddliaceae bacterium]|nr:geranyl transferase [Waddliaceae bacterium]
MDNLLFYKEKTEQAILDVLQSYGEQGTLGKACHYALVQGGKRVRPSISMMVADALNKNYSANQSAVTIEFFHTASLIGDDLPCMDDDDLRRERPALHKAYNEGLALLSTYALIASGYELISRNTRVLIDSGMAVEEANHRCFLALENATHNTGFFGATGGQYLDLCPPNYEEATILEIIKRKTSSLFEVSFVFGWLFGGGDIARLEQVKDLGQCYGTAFQIVDDLHDFEDDVKLEQNVNYACLFGVEQASKKIEKELKRFESGIKELNIASASLMKLKTALLDSLLLATT